MSDRPTYEPRRLTFRVEYDGTGLHGWQMQRGDYPTVQGLLNDAASDVLGVAVVVDGASRTDAGVHAADQLAAVTVRLPIRPKGFVKAINKRLPAGVGIRDCVEVPLDYSPRFGNGGKTYLYRFYISESRRPLLDRYAWRLHYDLDLARLADGARHLVGHHDFTSFASSDSVHKTAIRTIWRIEAQWHGIELHLRICGRAFMKQMVRNIAGTLVDVARGHLPADEIPRILAGRSRCLAGRTAPACGLLLERIHPRPAIYPPPCAGRVD